MKHVPPPPPPRPVVKAGGCMIPLLIGATLLATAIGVWPSIGRADTCRLPNVITCAKPLAGDPTRCNPEPALFACTRRDGTTYSVPAWTIDRDTGPNETAKAPKAHGDRR